MSWDIELMAEEELRALTVLERRAIVARLHLLKWDKADIAKRFGVTIRTIDRDLEAVRKLWQEAALFNFNEFMAEALREREMLQREYLRSWTLSKRGKAITATVLEELDGEDAERAALAEELGIEVEEPMGEAEVREVVIGYEELAGNIEYLNGASRELDKKIELIMGGKRLKVGVYQLGANGEPEAGSGEGPRRAAVRFYLPEKGSLEDDGLIDLSPNGKELENGYGEA